MFELTVSVLILAKVLKNQRFFPKNWHQICLFGPLCLVWQGVRRQKLLTEPLFTQINIIIITSGYYESVLKLTF